MATKIKLDTKAAMVRHAAASSAAAEDRFAAAELITRQRPNALSLVGVDDQQGAAFSLALCVPGAIVEVPLSLIDLNPVGPRHFYRGEEVDRIAETLPDGQDDAAHGFVRGGRIQLIDGGTRYRAARITDRGVLAVKIEEAPANDLELFRRARALNDQRSPTTALDFAMSLKNLLDGGVVASQDDLAREVTSPDGGALSKSMVSMFLRIARMPERVQRAMSEQASTSSQAALYAVSEIFEGWESKDETSRERDLGAALHIVDEIKLRKLNRAQITGLVKSHLQGPKTRARSVLTPLDFGEQRGQIKLFGRKGQIDLSFKGLTEAELPAVRQALTAAIEGYMKTRRDGGGPG